MRIDIWSDVVCPWCYIGKRRLENALADFEHADDVEVVYHSFQLDPGAPRQTDETVAEHLGAKYGGGPAAGQQMIDRVEAVAAEEGLLFRLGHQQAGACPFQPDMGQARLGANAHHGMKCGLQAAQRKAQFSRDLGN